MSHPGRTDLMPAIPRSTHDMSHPFLRRYRPMQCSQSGRGEPVGKTRMGANDRFYIGHGEAKVDRQPVQPVRIALLRERHSGIPVRQMLRVISNTVPSSRRELEEAVRAAAGDVATKNILRKERRHVRKIPDHIAQMRRTPGYTVAHMRSANDFRNQETPQT